MKYDTIIIGGGLAGLIAGIELQEKGQRTAIVSSGQGALHFSSGSMGLLGRDADGNVVEKPLVHLTSLKDKHPYHKVGIEKISDYARVAKALFERAGVAVIGSEASNHYTLTPIGAVKPAWLSTADSAVSPSTDLTKWGATAVVGLRGYLDFYPGFVADNLKKMGVDCSITYVTTPEIDSLRKNSTEMRATGIARIMHGQALEKFAKAIAEAAPKAETIIIPAVIGLENGNGINELRRLTGKKVLCLSTHPISVPGVRMQMSLRRYYEKVGGTYLLGDNVTAGTIKDGKMLSVDTSNLGKAALTADNFIIATGSYFSRGLVAEPQRIIEPIFGFDVDIEGTRQDWYRDNIFEAQPFVEFGLHTDEAFRVAKDGKTLDNVYAAGSILGGCNSLKEGSGAGVAIMTAMEVASLIAAKVS